MKSFLEGIQYLFEEILFLPLNFLRDLELKNWWTANIMSWVFLIICCYYLVYWLKQLKIFKDNKEDEQDSTSHSYLK